MPCFLWFADFRSQNRVPNGPSEHHDGLPSRPSFGRTGAPPPPSRAPPSLPTKSTPSSGPPKPPPPASGTRPPPNLPGSRPPPPQGRGAPPPKTDSPGSVRLCVCLMSSMYLLVCTHLCTSAIKERLPRCDSVVPCLSVPTHSVRRGPLPPVPGDRGGPPPPPPRNDPAPPSLPSRGPPPTPQRLDRPSTCECHWTAYVLRCKYSLNSLDR